MIAKVLSAAVVGMDARPVEVEVSIRSGLPDFNIVGLPSAAVREARRRVPAALENSGETWPQKRVVANLAPSDLRKEGAALDLAMAVGVLIADRKLKPDPMASMMFLGELALDGRVRPVRGALSAAVTARRLGAKAIVVPESNSAEAALVPGIDVLPAATLSEVLSLAEGGEGRTHPPPDLEALLAQPPEGIPDMSEVRGQALARRALEIAAAGGHNVLMVGPPGCGKTMLAQRMPGIMPPLTADEALEVTQIWSVAGLLPHGQALVTHRPFRAPHHHSSAGSIIGGGSPFVRPGEISLAHKGILFLDELPLFSTSILEGLRQPLEEGSVSIARTGGVVRFPSDVCLIGAANPCICGAVGHDCRCAPGRLETYRARLTGPLLDRIDLYVQVSRLSGEEMLTVDRAEPSLSVRSRVITAREFAADRSANKSSKVADIDERCRRLLGAAWAAAPTSTRSLTRTVRVARTIADLAGEPEIKEEHIAEALMFRRMVWE